jgi:hypothetical protein
VSLVERVVVGFDIQRFSSRVPRRQVLLQRELDRMLDDAADAAGVSRKRWERRAEGDGEVAVLPADVDLLAVVRRFPSELDLQLTDHNEDHIEETRIRLRVAMHIDAITPGALGYAGPALVVLKRLLDSAPVRTALVEKPEANLALIISESFYQKSVLPELGGMRPRQFRKVQVDLPAKNFCQTAYVYASPHFSTPPPEPRHLSTPPLDQSPYPVRGPEKQPGFPFSIPTAGTTPRQRQPPAAAKEPPSPAPEPPLSPAVRSLVPKIRRALADHDIERADILTTLALLEAAGRSDNGWLRASDIRELPDVLFTAVNTPWAEFSGGAWGFRAQRERIDGLALSAPGGFRKLSAAFGWGGNGDEIPPYAEFILRRSRGVPFYPTLRNPERERSHREWDDEWSAMVKSVYCRLQDWEH